MKPGSVHSGQTAASHRAAARWLQHQAGTHARRRTAIPPRAHQPLDRGQGRADLGLCAGDQAQVLDPAVRRDEPDSVHRMRVATRRLRSTLQSFPAILHKPAVEHLRGELKWLGGVLGDAREAEVLSERLLAALAAMPTELVMGPAEARVRIHFAPRVAGARTAVTSALDSGRYFALLEALDELIADPPLTAKAALPARNVLSKAVRRGGGRTRRRIRRALRTPAGRNRDAALHEVRKAARRARYATEAAKPVLGKRARRFARRMKAVQSILGDQHDAVNARRPGRSASLRTSRERTRSASACCTNRHTATRASTSARPGECGPGVLAGYSAGSGAAMPA
jgi:CHAD domain-containing protein